MRQVSLAVPTYNRFALVLQCIAVALQDECVSEIVLVDDASTNGAYDLLKEYEVAFSKLRLYQNAHNLDCYGNKKQAVNLCNFDHVILFDSDNIIDKPYLDSLFAIPEWDARTIYAPTFAWPDFDYRAFEGVEVNRKNIVEYLDKPHFLTALNTANYMVPKAAYLEAFDPAVKPYTADSIFMAFRLLEKGYTFSFVKGMHYFHRVHSESHYKLNHHKTGRFYDDVVQELRRLR